VGNSPEGDASSLRGFDATAARYDADTQANRVLVHLRARLFQQLRTAFPPGSKLIEIGSGTGAEAARLASERGCRIALVDVSPRLLERAAAKVRAARPEGLLGAHLLAAGSVGDLVTLYGRAFFDGAYSSLGPLNCEPSLAPVADGVAALVRTGGVVVLSIMNRW
jgi:SAM-dependent methyltransferase